jgi:hypothetical protein
VLNRAVQVLAHVRAQLAAHHPQSLW